MKSNYLLIFALLLFGCGGDGDLSGSDSPASVKEIRITPNVISVGEISTVEVAFDPAQTIPPDLDQSDDETPSANSDAFDLVVQVPAGVDYVTDSSKISDEFVGDVIFGDADKRNPNQVGLCDDGRRFLLYFFSAGELAADTLVRQRLLFQVSAYEVHGGTVIAAAANYSIPDPCTELPEQIKAITVQN